MPPQISTVVLTSTLLFISACAMTPSGPVEVRAISYNIRLDTEADGANAWPHRRDAVAALLNFYDPDLLGLQEVKAHQLAALRADLSQYEFLGVGRDDGLDGGEFSPIAYRRDRFALSETGTFWLSETPDIPSRGFDAAFPRIVTWARLKEKSSGRRVLLLNTHWDHIGIDARLQSGRIIADWLASRNGVCEQAIVLGDFNAYPDTASIAALAGSDTRPLTLARSASESEPFGPPGTFTGFEIARADPAPIDHVLVGGALRVLRYGVITQHAAARLPSDHYPVLADIVVPPCSM